MSGNVTHAERDSTRSANVYAGGQIDIHVGAKLHEGSKIAANNGWKCFYRGNGKYCKDTYGSAAYPPGDAKWTMADQNEREGNCDKDKQCEVVDAGMFGWTCNNKL